MSSWTCTPILALLVLSTASPAVAAEQSAAEQSVAERSSAEQLQAVARQADEDREAARLERAAWQTEQAQHALYRQVQDEQLATVEAALAQVRIDLAAAEARASNADADREQVAQLAQHVATLRQRINQAVDQATHDSLLVAHGEAPAEDASLGAAFERLVAAERAARRMVMTTRRVQLPDGERAVQVLALGGAAGWWRALDGSAAGTLAVRAGALVGTPVSGPQFITIQQAFQAFARDRAALVDVPFAGDR